MRPSSNCWGVGAELYVVLVAFCIPVLIASIMTLINFIILYSLNFSCVGKLCFLAVAIPDTRFFHFFVHIVIVCPFGENVSVKCLSYHTIDGTLCLPRCRRVTRNQGYIVL